MKKQFFFSMLAAAAMMASCSSDREVAENSELNPIGDGYMSVAINLPTVPVTRASDAEVEFSDGLKSEYRVNDATLILFSGSDERSATFSQAYTLKTAAWDDNTDDPNQITVTRQITQKVTSTGSTLYALVVLNRNGLFEVTTGNKLSVQSSNFTGTIVDLENAISDADFTANGILMMNAPLSKLQGSTLSNDPGTSGYGITTLAEVDPSKIKSTAALAEADPAASIYVERAVAKTTVNVSSTIPSSFTGTGGAINYTIQGWKLDNTNKKSYIAHKYDETTTLFPEMLSWKSGKTGSIYRMVGNYPVETGAGYRYYWALDPNYKTVADPADMNRLASTTPSFNAMSSSIPEYCKENTFDVANQTYENTTSVLIKAQLNDGTPFYTINDENKVYLSYEDAFKSVFMANGQIASWVSANVEGSYTVTASDFDFTYSTNATTKVVTVTSVAEGASLSGHKTGTAPLPDITSILNETKVLYYDGGISYYHVRIKHFGDNLTPWNDWEPTATKPTPANAYPGTDATDINNRYLGRYGMVRNNWYDITVQGISKIGSPVIPSLAGDDTTDDNLESYISVKINILSWAKRLQSVTL